MYARSANEGGDVGIPGAGGVPGFPGSDSTGNYNLVPSNVYPQTIAPGGEILPGAGPQFLPGGVPVGSPAYPGRGGPFPFYDPSTLPEGGGAGRYGKRRSGGKLYGSRIINVNLPRMISAGQPFSIITTFRHEGDNFGNYKIKLNIPILQVVVTSDEKKVANNAQATIVLNLTAPSPLPDAPVTGTVELVEADGPEITIDSEVITIPTEKVPNPPSTEPEPEPMPEPTPEPDAPTAPPPPPVPLPPVLQLINLNITRGEDGGMQSIIIEASGLEPSEPTSLFIYLRDRELRGHRYGQERDPRLGGVRDLREDITNRYQDLLGDREKLFEQFQQFLISRRNNAGATVNTNVAYAYPVSIQGTTANGNGLRLTRSYPAYSYSYPAVSASDRMALQTDIRNRVTQAIQSRGESPTLATIAAQAAERAAASTPSEDRVSIRSSAAGEAAKSVLENIGGGTVSATTPQLVKQVAARQILLDGGSAVNVRRAVIQAAQSAGTYAKASDTAGVAAEAAAGGATATTGGGVTATAGGGGATASAGGGGATATAPGIAVGEPHPSAPRHGVFKRQRLTITASPDGTIRHVVRVRDATAETPLFGFVVIYGNRSRKHSGRRQFSL